MLVKPFHRPGWVYEEKIDGWRLGAYKVGSNVRLVSRKGVEHTSPIS
jgi:ATP-dependent DNA ligase